jgi:hypothetical protein
MDVIGLTYLICLAAWMAAGPRMSTWLWPAFLVGICVIVALQYFSALGFPPYTNLSVPWHSLSDTLLSVLGLAKTPKTLFILSGTLDFGIGLRADLFLLFFCALQQRVFNKRRVDIDAPTRLWAAYEASLQQDFTHKPRYVLPPLN